MTVTMLSRQGRFRLNADAFAESSVDADPPVDEAAIVYDLETRTADRFNEVEVLIPSHLTQNDVPDGERGAIDWHHSAELTRLDLSLHGGPARTEGDSLSGPKLLDILCGPAQNPFSQDDSK